MGIRRLQTYVQKQVPNGYVKVDIREEINLWKRNNNGSSPLIVIDLMAIVSLGNSNKRDTILGGRHKIIKELYEQFFQNLIDCGATLEFFIDGLVQNDKFNVWIQRQNQKYNKSIQFFDAINQGASIDELIEYHLNNIQQITTFVHSLKILAKKFGRVKTSNHHECDAEIANFATKNNALAIFTNDSDFMIFEGNWHLWCMEKLDVNNLQCMELSRSALTQHLGLSYNQMALFSTLAGNDFIEYDRIKIFLASLGQYHVQFKNLANFIRKMNKLPMNLNDLDLSDLAKRLFGKSSTENIELIRKSIKSYDLNFEILHSNESNELLKKCSEVPSIYIILTNAIDTLTLSYCDLREPDFLPYYDLILPIIRRHYGILLDHDKLNTPTRILKSIRYHNGYVKEFTITPDYPKVTVPPLLEFIYDEENKCERLYNTRWNLLLWSIFGNSNSNHQHISRSKTSKEVYCTLFTLLYLRMQNQIDVYVADAMLLSVIDNKNNVIPKTIEYPKYVTTRAMMLSHLFTKVFNIISRGFYICGLKEFEEMLLFDGVYFCNLLISMENEEIYSQAVERIMEYRPVYFDLNKS